MFIKYLRVPLVAVLSIVLLSIIATAGAENSSYHPEITVKDLESVCIISGGPDRNDIDDYEYSTDHLGEMKYIIHYLNSMNLVDDGEVYLAWDIPEFGILIHYRNNQTREAGFYFPRFYDSKDGVMVPTDEAKTYFSTDRHKQYGTDFTEYQNFLDMIYAIKAGKYQIPEDIALHPSSWANAEVEAAISAGLLPEIYRINYEGTTLRIEVSQLIANLLKQHGFSEGEYKRPFSDTRDGSANMLYELGIVNGRTETQFCPYDPITRQELAKLLSNTYRLLQGEGPAATGELPYADWDRIGGWAVESVADMLSLGILRGNDRNEFQPERMVTKEEVILSLLRLHEAVSA